MEKKKDPVYETVEKIKTDQVVMLCIRLGGQTHNGSYKEECFSLGLLSSEAPLPPPSLNSHPSVLSEKSHSPRLWIARNCAA